VRARYERLAQHNSDTPTLLEPSCWPGINAGALAAFGPARLGFLPLQLGYARAKLDSAPQEWPELDCKRVPLDDDYLPLPPEFDPTDDEHAQALTAALTHVFCRLRFQVDLCSDQRYKWLGQHLCKAAITLAACRKLSSVSAADLDVSFFWCRSA
jgi:hypothetical protein